jgi:hypothetical protein
MQEVEEVALMVMEPQAERPASAVCCLRQVGALVPQQATVGRLVPVASDQAGILTQLATMAATDNPDSLAAALC